MKPASMSPIVIAFALAFPVILAMTFSAAAEEWQDAFTKKEFKTDNGVLKYRIYAPEFEDGKKYPLVLFLHGAGERGDDNEKQLVWGAKEFSGPAVQSKYPSIVVFPQCPSGEKWSNVDWSARSSSQPKEPSDSMALTFGLLDELLKDMPVDADRVYLAGLSMGGYGTWDALGRKPDLFAAAAPICGGGDPAIVESFKDVPIWVFHGDKDNAVPVERSRKMVEALKAAGSNVKYTEYPGVGHNSWSPTFENEEFFDWLYDQKKGQ